MLYFIEEFRYYFVCLGVFRSWASLYFGGALDSLLSKLIWGLISSNCVSAWLRSYWWSRQPRRFVFNFPGSHIFTAVEYLFGKTPFPWGLRLEISLRALHTATAHDLRLDPNKFPHKSWNTIIFLTIFSHISTRRIADELLAPLGKVRMPISLDVTLSIKLALGS